MKKENILNQLSSSESKTEQHVSDERRQVMGGIAAGGLATVGLHQSNDTGPKPISTDEARSIISEWSELINELDRYSSFNETAETAEDRVEMLSERASEQLLRDQNSVRKKYAVVTSETADGEMEMGFARDNSDAFVDFPGDDKGERFIEMWNKKQEVKSNEQCSDCSGVCRVEDCDCCPTDIGVCGCECVSVFAGDCPGAFLLCTCCKYHSWCSVGCTDGPYNNC